MYNYFIKVYITIGLCVVLKLIKKLINYTETVVIYTFMK